MPSTTAPGPRATDRDPGAAGVTTPRPATGVPRFTGRVRTAARWGWAVLVALIVWMTVRAVPLNLALLRSVCPAAGCADQRLSLDQAQALQAAGWSMDGFARFTLAANLLPPLVYLAVAALLVVEERDDGMAFFTALALTLFGGVTYSDFLQQLAVSRPVWAGPFVVLKYLGSVCIVAFLFLFPSGRLVPRWLRFVLALWMVEEAFDVVSAPPLNLHLSPEGLTDIAFVIILVAAIFAQGYRYRRVSTAAQRRQTKWVVYGVSVAFSAILVVAAVDFFVPIRRDNVQLLIVLNTIVIAAFTLLPISIAIAILRARLFDIDLLINRTLLYSTITAILAGVLSVSSDLTKRTFIALTGRSSDVAPMVATLVVVAAFDPVKRGVSRFVDARFKYPSHSFGAFEERLREHIELCDAPALLTKFLHQAVATFDARSGAVHLADGADRTCVAVVGDADAPAALTVPLAGDDGLAVGELTLGPRADGEGYGEGDRRTLAVMAGLVARAMGLTVRAGGAG